MNRAWATIRRDVLKRDNHTCQDCGSKVGSWGDSQVKNAEVHHKTPRVNGGSDDPDNLVTLCGECHSDRPAPIEGRDGRGRFAKAATLDEVLAEFNTVDGPAVTSTDVAERFDITTEAARRKLASLVDRGDLEKRKSGRTTLYWESDDIDD